MQSEYYSTKLIERDILKYVGSENNGLPIIKIEKGEAQEDYIKVGEFRYASVEGMQEVISSKKDITEHEKLLTESSNFTLGKAFETGDREILVYEERDYNDNYNISYYNFLQDNKSDSILNEIE